MPKRSRNLRSQLKATWPFGCLYAILLGVPAAFVVLLANVMGDCEPDSNCHDHAGAKILLGWAFVAAILIPLVGIIWLLTAKVRSALRTRYQQGTVTFLLLAFVAFAAWLSWEAGAYIITWST